MRIRVLSDLHLEFQPPWRWPDDHDSYDMIIAAGDIASSCVTSVEALAGLGPCIFTPGNHEHYGQIFQDNIAAGRTAAAETSVFFLSRDALVIGRVRFVGATLWTDYALYRTPKPSMNVAGQGLNDHRLARYRERNGDVSRFLPRHARLEHLTDLKFIAMVLAKPHDGPTVVITHHLPSSRSIAPKFAGDEFNPAFASDLDAFILERQPAVWIHGHTHDSCDYRLGATRIVCNPWGYRGENSSFNASLTIEI